MLTQDRAVAGDPAAPGDQALPLWLQFHPQACGKADPCCDMTASKQNDQHPYGQNCWTGFYERSLPHKR